MVQFSQVFLRDPEYIEKIVSALTEDRSLMVFVEVGPGEGVITKELLKRGATVHAIEVDLRLVDRLKKDLELKLVMNRRFFLYHADFLKFDLRQLPSPIRFFSNLPYAITSDAIHRIINYRDMFHDVHLLLQKEVVDKLLSGNSYLSLWTGYHFDVERLFNVPRSAFHPTPKVHSSFVRMKPRDRMLDERGEKILKRILKQSFKNRRKKLKNALTGFKIPQEMSERRPEELRLEDFIRIAEVNV